jgi:Spy/CpxP family protein refolding chaperone
MDPGGSEVEDRVMRKRIVAVLAMLVMGAGMVMAAQQQGKMGKQGRMGRMDVDKQVANMKAHLNLTDEQAAQVKELFQKQNEEMKAWRQQNPNATRQDMRAHHRQLWQERNEGLKKILTPEQFKMHQENRRRGMKRGPKGPPQP